MDKGAEIYRSFLDGDDDALGESSIYIERGLFYSYTGM